MTAPAQQNALDALDALKAKLEKRNALPPLEPGRDRHINARIVAGAEKATGIYAAPGASLADMVTTWLAALEGKP